MAVSPEVRGKEGEEKRVARGTFGCASCGGRRR